MTVFTPDKAPKGAVWVCGRCGRFNKSRAELHKECNCAPTPGGFDRLAESSGLTQDEFGRVVDFHEWYPWRTE